MQIYKISDRPTVNKTFLQKNAERERALERERKMCYGKRKL